MRRQQATDEPRVAAPTTNSARALRMSTAVPRVPASSSEYVTVRVPWLVKGQVLRSSLARPASVPV